MDAEKVSRSSLSQARRQLENAGADLAGAVFNNFDTTKGAGYQYSYYTYYYEYRETEGKDKSNGARHRPLADRRRAGKAIGFEHDETPVAGLPGQVLPSEGLPTGASPGGHTNGGSATNGGSPTADDLISPAWLEGLTAPVTADQRPQASVAPAAPKTPQAPLPPSQPGAVAPPDTVTAPPPIPPGPVAHGPITNGGSPKPLQATPSSDDEDRRDGWPWWTPQSS
jgi:hypothetical protein